HPFPLHHLCLHITRHLAAPTLFPYTTLFRSGAAPRDLLARRGGARGRRGAGGGAREGRGGRRRRGQGRGLLREGQAAFREDPVRSEEHTSELQSPDHLVCRLLLEKKTAYALD